MLSKSVDSVERLEPANYCNEFSCDVTCDENKTIYILIHKKRYLLKLFSYKERITLYQGMKQ